MPHPREDDLHRPDHRRQSDPRTQRHTRLAARTRHHARHGPDETAEGYNDAPDDRQAHSCYNPLATAGCGRRTEELRAGHPSAPTQQP
eukprot:15748845-Heterocapsa_arctica.AAC.1